MRQSDEGYHNGNQQGYRSSLAFCRASHVSASLPRTAPIGSAASYAQGVPAVHHPHAHALTARLRRPLRSDLLKTLTLQASAPASDSGSADGSRAKPRRPRRALEQCPAAPWRQPEPTHTQNYTGPRSRSARRPRSYCLGKAKSWGNA